MIDEEDQGERQDLYIKRADRRRDDRDEGRHRQVLHHRAGRTLGTDNRAERLGMGHVNEDA
jgi:hypothetical protein